MKENSKHIQTIIPMILKIISIETAVIIIFSWIFGGLHLMSSFYFFISAILLIISIYPLWSDGGVKGFTKNKKKGLIIDNNPEELERKRNDRSDKLYNSISFGISGVISFIFSILSSSLF